MISLPTRSLCRFTRSFATTLHPSPSIISTNQSNSGLKVLSTHDNSKLTSSISLFVKAGSRHEPSPGLAHLLKNMLFKSTENRSALRLIRETELLGGVLTTSLSREHLILNAEFLKGQENYFIQVLADVLTSSKFSRHEFNEEALPGTLAESNQAQSDSMILAIDCAHQLAFRKGLGNSLFADPSLPVSHDSAVEFARSSFANLNQHSIVATGIDPEKLLGLVNEFFAPSSSSISTTSVSSSKSSYHGGDIRLTSHAADTFLLAFKGAQNSNQPEFTVLQHLLGSNPVLVKWSHGPSPLSSLPVKTFHFPYSDNGLFGFVVKAEGSHAHQVASKALAELKKVADGNAIDKEAVDRAASKAQFLVASSLESNILKTESLGIQSLTTNTSPQGIQDLYSSYAQVTPDKVIQAAKSALNSRPTVVAVGNTKELPYAEDLGF
ncbi:hypothetical protein O181_030740 [Austropuccinia psidii MF-1]|uniref:Cytochrome b-c1 complex subunit 2, mitochondrial n=1 Tax=Austropuccinia psidii MF-1 TaxID=1389203 RepID=A0A9Q3CWQ4_9BASI|nr:hypothetical protein [Austropuccinia psidii MF-1]